MKGAAEYIQQKLAERQQAGSYRLLRVENDLIDFCSNDYLGFARSATMKHYIDAEMANHPEAHNGSGGSRLLAGNSLYTETLEAEIADWHKSEAALLYNSGYDANLGLFSSLPQRGDTIILDELAHASIIDGARLSNANRYSFKHNDLESLEQKLRAAKGNIFIGIECIYSMDGDSPPITQILDLADEYNAAVIVDEAHAVGLYKYGLIAHLNLQHRVFARVITFGKAMGCHGAAVLSSNTLREYLINFSRSFIYTTAAPLHQLAAIRSAYKMLLSADDIISDLHERIALFKDCIDKRNVSLIPSDSAIQCIILGSNERAKNASKIIAEHGMDVRAIMSPTVAASAERLRICLHTHNTIGEIRKLASVINKL